MSSEWSEGRRASLRAFCDCVFPSLSYEPDVHGFWHRKASDFGIDLASAQVLDASVPEPQRSGLLGLLDVFAAQGIVDMPAQARERLLQAVAASSEDARLGVTGLMRIVLSLAYALPDECGVNPNWKALGYPGPRKPATPQEKRIKPLAIDSDTTLDADVCVVGSGAGGGVIAAHLQQRGLSVVVLEAGGYYNEGDFNQLELWAFQNLYWRGGYNATADGNVAMLAGATLGGGTTVNWQNCVRTPSWVRSEWEREHGLEGLENAAFEGALSGVLERIQANDRCSDLNGPHQRLAQGAEKLGYHFKRCLRNVDPARYDAETAGFQGFGDITGSRQGTLNTYLDDAFRAGARIVTRAKALRINTAAGRAESVRAAVTDAAGAVHTLTVRARHVVVACGALETPALLLRSGIGGQAAGRYLHLHPTVAISGRYAEDQRAWWGPPQAGLSDQLLRLDGDHGILLECAHHSLTVAASVAVSLHRQIGWANIRDKLSFGHIDAAHALLGMPLTSHLGRDSFSEPLVALMGLGSGGNAITIRRELFESGIKSATDLAHFMKSRPGLGRLMTGHVFGASMHHYLLREWLASGGIDPDKDVKLCVIPPPQMTEHMLGGYLDIFCVGEPWNTIAAREGAGVTLLATTDILPRHPEKVLAVSQRYAESTGGLGSQTMTALVRAVLRGCLWCAETLVSGAGRELSTMLARPEYLAQPRDIIEESLLINRDFGAADAPRGDRPNSWVVRSFSPENLGSGAGGTFPNKMHAVWMMKQMIRWGHLHPAANVAEIAEHCCDTAAYRAAANSLGVSCPDDDFVPMELRGGRVLGLQEAGLPPAARKKTEPKSKIARSLPSPARVA